MCDLITSTKNEKIFQESIGLAIRLLDGGNTEIQVWGAGARLLWAGASSSGGGRCQVSVGRGGLAAGLSAGGHFESGYLWAAPPPTSAPFLSTLSPSAAARPEPVSHLAVLHYVHQPLLTPPSLLFHALHVFVARLEAYLLQKALSAGFISFFPSFQ